MAINFQTRILTLVIYFQSTFTRWQQNQGKTTKKTHDPQSSKFEIRKLFILHKKQKKDAQELGPLSNKTFKRSNGWPRVFSATVRHRLKALAVRETFRAAGAPLCNKYLPTHISIRSSERYIRTSFLFGVEMPCGHQFEVRQCRGEIVENQRPTFIV